mgnify:CR=1 FL=1
MVFSVDPETGTALPEAPFSSPVATTNASVAVWEVPVSGSWAATTIVCGPETRGSARVYVQLPFASAVTVTVIGSE